MMMQASGQLHKGSKSGIGDIDSMIEKSGCSQIYFKLEDCLGENDRDWTKCQAEVKALQKCNSLVQKRRKENLASQKAN